MTTFARGQRVIGATTHYVDNQPPYRLGPAIDRWVEPGTAAQGQRSVELATAEGNATIAVRVRELGDGTWRYDYAVMNLDFARAETSGCIRMPIAVSAGESP